MGLIRRRDLTQSKKLLTKPIQRHHIFLQGTKILVISMHKCLGVLMDQELFWKENVNYGLQKGLKWVTQ